MQPFILKNAFGSARLSRRLLIPLYVGLLLSSAAAYPFAVSMPTQWSTETAIEILRQGGNATDAMVAASFVLNVTQPYNMGIGGGGFYLLENRGRVQFWDSRETAPSSASEKMFLGKDGKPINYYPERVSGPNPVGVPGMVAGLWSVHKKLGKLPWKTVLAPSVRVAREGFPITQDFARIIAAEWPRLSGIPTTAAIFGDKEGGPLKTGRLLRQPLLAQTLERIARDGAESFYSGALAASWLAEAAALGVKISAEDLSRYAVRETPPIEFKVFGLRAVTAPLPSTAGVMVAGALRFLEHYYRSHDVPAADSPTRVIVTTEALKFFQALRDRDHADLGSSKIDPKNFLGSPEEKKAWEEIESRVLAKRDKIETRFTSVTRPKDMASENASSHTAHLSIVDDHGMAVAYTSTIEQWFGSGLTVPGHGFLLNNELSDFTAEPGKPNSPAPGKKPRSNMSPMLLFEGKKLVGSLGCAGGGRIATVVVELLENYFIHKMSLREAIAFPRFHPVGDLLELDPAFSGKLDQSLKEAGYEIKRVFPGGVPHALLRRSGRERWEAAAEPRADGMAIVLESRGK